MNIGCSLFYAKNFGDDLFYNIWTDVFKQHEVFNLFKKELMSVDKIIIGGGGLISQFYFEPSFFREEFFKHPTYVYGIGINDIRLLKSDVINQYEHYFKSCKQVYLREPLDFSSYINVEDMIWSMDLPAKKRMTNVIGLSMNTVFCDDAFYHLCNRILKLRMDVYIIDLYSHQSNKSLYDRLIQTHNNDIRIKYIRYNRDNLSEIFNVLSSLKFYITQKLHGFIVASMYNIPSICIGNMNKYKVIRDKLNMQHCFIDDIKSLDVAFKNNIHYKYDFSEVPRLQDKSKTDLANFTNIILND